MANNKVYCIHQCFHNPCVWEKICSAQRGLHPSLYCDANVAAASGHLSLLKLNLSSSRGMMISGDAFDSAAANGDFATVEWLMENWNTLQTCATNQTSAISTGGALLCTSQTVSLVAERGHLGMVEWLHCHVPGAFVTTNLVEPLRRAAGNGHLAMVEWLIFTRDHPAVGLDRRLSLSQPIPDNVVSAAAGGGHLDVLEWLQQKQGEPPRQDAFEIPARNGHLSTIEWLCTKFPEEAEQAAPTMLVNAAKYSHLAVLQCLLARYSSSLPQAEKMQALGRVVETGNLPAAELLMQHVCPQRYLLGVSFQIACKNGHLAMVEWSERVMNQQQLVGHIAEDAMNAAAGGGHLAVVEWLNAKRGVECDSKAIGEAASNGHLHVLEWLLANQWKGATNSTLNLAARDGHTHVVEWLLKNELVENTNISQGTLDIAAREGHLKTLEWIHANLSHSIGSGYTTWAMDWGARKGHLDVLKLVAKHSTEGFTGRALNGAVQNNHLDVVEWFCTHQNARNNKTYVHSAYTWAMKEKRFLIAGWLQQYMSTSSPTICQSYSSASRSIS